MKLKKKKKKKKKKISKYLGIWLSENYYKKEACQLSLILHLAENIYESKIPINNSQNVVTLKQNMTELEPDGTLILFEGVEVQERVDLFEF